MPSAETNQCFLLFLEYHELSQSNPCFCPQQLDETKTSFTMNVMLGGYDEKTGGKLYWFDFLGTCLELPYATHGFGGFLAASILDRYYRPGELNTLYRVIQSVFLSEEGVELLPRTCALELQAFVATPYNPYKLIEARQLTIG